MVVINIEKGKKSKREEKEVSDYCVDLKQREEVKENETKRNSKMKYFVSTIYILTTTTTTAQHFSFILPNRICIVPDAVISKNPA